MSSQSTRTFRFVSALVAGRWQQQVCVTVGAGGRISRLTQGDSGPVDHDLPWVALPAMPNVHSHAFQRGLVGLSEFRSATRDSFWTWRKLMFAFLAELTPDEVFIVARQLYLEMLMGGYGWVGEFHYLHNQPGGRPYDCLSEMAEVHLRAAAEAGIGICLLPVLYQRGGFDGSPLAHGQNRFGLTLDQYFELARRTRSLVDGENSRSGIALHSLRAVSTVAGQQALRELAEEGVPVHMHVAEQTLEVEDCLAAHGRRPVQYLLENFPVDRNWCLIHATHLVPDEIRGLAGSGAVAGLCPTTEGNLGDGFFPAREWLEQGGRISIGSDSHCGLDFREELRWMEYAQRLQRRERAVLGTAEQSVGRRLFEATVAGGSQALGLGDAAIAVGGRMDLMLVDPQHPAISGAEGDRLLDRLVFAGSPGIHGPVAGMITGGVWHDFASNDWKDRFAASSRELHQLTRRKLLDALREVR